MADYYPLIARAVAGLEKNNGENRRALYERARGALLAQLRSVTPALNESDITRERLALEESIRKVEAEAARKFTESARQPPPRIRPIEPRSPEEAPEAREAPRRHVAPPAEPLQESRLDAARRARAPLPPVRPVASSPPLPRGAAASKRQPDLDLPDHPLPSEKPALAAPVPLRRPAAERSPIPRPAKEPRTVVPRIDDMPEALPRLENQPRESYPPPPPIAELDRAPRFRGRQDERFQDRAEERVLERNLERPQDRAPAPDRAPVLRSELRMPQPEAPAKDGFERERDSYSYNDFSEPMLESSFVLDDAHPIPEAPRHVPAPPEEEEPRFGRITASAREWLAWRPSRELLRGISASAAALAVLGVLAWQWPNMVQLYRGMRAPPAEIARETPTPATHSKITDRIEPGTQTAATPSAGAQAGAAVAQKVVLYEEDPSDPNGKRFVGSAIWRTETVTPGPGQPPELAIRADVEVPERKLAMTWSLRRNTDKSLPASHTVEIIFKLPAEFPAGGISNVPGILMKQAEQTRGTPLAGLAVKVTSGFFLIGLSSVDADRERNLQLLKDRAWFDIPVVYSNNRRAILAMEKGTPGERVFAEAFKVWKQ
ncbi:MAG TPA: hypothetical protein VH678_14650 [Xanthobacteraceae bacterium]|jgi:hypothetical protein